MSSAQQKTAVSAASPPKMSRQISSFGSLASNSKNGGSSGSLDDDTKAIGSASDDESKTSNAINGKTSPK